MYAAAPENHDHPVKAMFVVPKRSFKKAHDRNKLRRRMKEAYRLNKNVFYADVHQVRLSLALIYTSRKSEDHAVISDAVRGLLSKLSEKL